MLSSTIIKSVKSGNSFESVIPTVSKDHHNHQKVETEESSRSKFKMKMPIK